MSDKFRVPIPGLWQAPWPKYFDNFYTYCGRKAADNGWHHDTVCNNELKPHGRLIKTSTQGWYLRWNDPKYHTLFVLKWS